MNYRCLSTNSVNMPDRQTNEQYISWKCAESRFLSLCVQKKCIINLKLFEPDQVRSLIVFAYLFASHLEALPFLLVINNSKQKKGKKITFYQWKKMVETRLVVWWIDVNNKIHISCTYSNFLENANMVEFLHHYD